MDSGSSRFSIAGFGRPTTNTSRIATRVKRSATKKIGANESSPNLATAKLAPHRICTITIIARCCGSMR
jgi:hypothetical protein